MVVKVSIDALELESFVIAKEGVPRVPPPSPESELPVTSTEKLNLSVSPLETVTFILRVWFVDDPAPIRLQLTEPAEAPFLKASSVQTTEGNTPEACARAFVVPIFKVIEVLIPARVMVFESASMKSVPAPNAMSLISNVVGV